MVRILLSDEDYTHLTKVYERAQAVYESDDPNVDWNDAEDDMRYIAECVMTAETV